MTSGDPEHHCFFEGDGETDPRALCHLDWTDSLTARYPRLNGAPIDWGASSVGLGLGLGLGLCVVDFQAPLLPRVFSSLSDPNHTDTHPDRPRPEGRHVVTQGPIVDPNQRRPLFPGWRAPASG